MKTKLPEQFTWLRLVRELFSHALFIFASLSFFIARSTVKVAGRRMSMI